MIPSVMIEIWSFFFEMMVVLSYAELRSDILVEAEDDDEEDDIDRSF